MFTLPNRREDSGVSLRDSTGTPTTPEGGPRFGSPFSVAVVGAVGTVGNAGAGLAGVSKACGKDGGEVGGRQLSAGRQLPQPFRRVWLPTDSAEDP